MPKTRLSRHITTFLFSKLAFGHFFNLVFALFVVNEENSKSSQISRSVINFQGKNPRFQGVSSDLEMTLQIPALFKGFKDLHELFLNTKTIKNSLTPQKSSTELSQLFEQLGAAFLYTTS